MPAGSMPRTPAQAAALSGFAARNWAIAAGSHADRLPVPPYSCWPSPARPAYSRSVVPAINRAPESGSTDAVTAPPVPAGGSVAGAGGLAATGTNGSEPGSEAAASTTVAGAASDRSRRIHTTTPATAAISRRLTPPSSNHLVRTVTRESSIRGIFHTRAATQLHKKASKETGHVFL